MSLLTLLAAALAILGLAPVAASASVASIGGPEPESPTSVVGTASDDQITITLVGADHVITDPAGITATGLCTASNPPNEVTCPSAGHPFLSVIGFNGNDSFTVASGAFTLGQFELGEGNDFFQGGNEDDGGQGGPGNDTINLGGANDGVNLCVFGDEGDDVISTEEGNDSCIAGNDGNDTLFGGPGNDQISGFRGNDTLHGGPGDDTLDLSAESCTLSGCLAFGDEGDDALFGDAGNDRLAAGFGADSADGGEGDDHVDGVKTDPSTIGFANPVFGVVWLQDGAIDDLRCGPGTGDKVRPGEDDVVALDCETYFEQIDCPAGETCLGEFTLTAPGGGSAASAEQGWKEG